MNGINYLLDTNVIIGVLKGNAEAVRLAQDIDLDLSAYSVITRMELLGFMGITDAEEQAINSLLTRMPCLGLTPDIEAATIQLKRQRRLKLPDAIIVATAGIYRLHLLTLDRQLSASLTPTKPPRPDDT